MVRANDPLGLLVLVLLGAVIAGDTAGLSRAEVRTLALGAVVVALGFVTNRGRA